METVTRLMIEQIERRRGFYLALVHGHGVADPRVSEVMDSVRDGSTDRVMAALDVPERQRDVVRAWWAYTEDRALTWSAVPTGERPVPLSQLVEECVAALHALLRDQLRWCCPSLGDAPLDGEPRLVVERLDPGRRAACRCRTGSGSRR